MLIQKQGWVVKKKLLVLVGFSAFACGASKLVKQVDVGMSNSWEHEEQRPNNYFFEQEPATVGAKKQRAHVVPSDRVEPEYAGPTESDMNDSWDQDGAFNVPIDRTDRPSARRITVKPSI